MAAMLVDVYRCAGCGAEYEEETPATCPCGGDTWLSAGRQESHLGPCPMCENTGLVASKRGPMVCLDCRASGPKQGVDRG